MRRAIRTATLLVAAPAFLGLTPVDVLRFPGWGLTVADPGGLARGTDFKSNYFDRGAWRVSYAADTGPGTKIIGLSLPDRRANDAGGESVATAELRIGASRDPNVVATCLDYGMHSGNDVESATRTIGGIVFTEVPDNSDAEMMKTIRSDDFRAVRKDVCWAIDLVTFIGGTANRPPEFTAVQLAQLHDVLGMIRFDP